MMTYCNCVYEISFLLACVVICKTRKEMFSMCGFFFFWSDHASEHAMFGSNHHINSQHM